MNVWEKNSRKLRRQAAFRRFDEWLQELYRQSPVKFHLLVIAVAFALCGIMFGITSWLDRF